MKLTFLGADREVTGSCTQLEAAGHRFLIDCGMEQGRDVYENEKRRSSKELWYGSYAF